jgi:cell wall-associated NlpC family hydrolase
MSPLPASVSVSASLSPRSSLRSCLLALVAAVVTLALVACGPSADPTTLGAHPGTSTSPNLPDDPSVSGGDIGDPGAADGPLVAADDNTPGFGGPTAGPTLPANSAMVTTANLNLRKGPGTSFGIVLVIPSGSTVTLLDATAQSGFLNVSFNGTAGWSSATYLTGATAPGGSSSGSGSSTGGASGGSSGGAIDLEGAPSPDNAFARAKAAVGFSYYWGGGAWLPSGVSSSTAGSCSGSCPSCSHGGKYGADCSGLVSKAWQFGTKALEVNSHAYSTASFVNDSAGHWSTVSRASLKKGDALVYNSGSAGHVVLYEKGDGWGTSTVVECKGCSYGCVYNARSFASSYKGIRRAGF